MEVKLGVDARSTFLKLDAIGPRVHQALVDELKPIAAAMLVDARTRAINHFHSIGKKPGLYLGAFEGGVSDKGSRVTGYVRNPNALAHLLEDGFTIKAWKILPNARKVMAFLAGVRAALAGEDSAGTAYARAVNRPETKVKPYPAVRPAFEAMRPAIEAALARALKTGTGSP